MDLHLIRSLCQDKSIKHVSFDFWGTICDSNQEFKNNRNSILAKISGKEMPVIKEAFDTVAHTHNQHMMSKASVKETSFSLFNQVLQKIGITDKNEELYQKCLSLFIEFLPLIRPGVSVTLSELKSNGLSCSILSNTAYIPGILIEAAMQKLKISDYFSFFIFSDRVGYGKPTPVIFQEVLTYSIILGKTKEITREEILHIGDNEKADLYGALDFGFHALLI